MFFLCIAYNGYSNFKNHAINGRKNKIIHAGS